MSKSKGFGVSSSTHHAAKQSRATNTQEWREMPKLDLETRTKLWQAGLLKLRFPDGMKPRKLRSTECSLIEEEKYWLGRAAAAEYISAQDKGLSAIFYTSPPPEFRLDSADWYLCPNEYWNRPPALLSTIVQTFPTDLFQLAQGNQPPAFYPDRTADYTQAQEAVMRSIFRETVRIGWSLLEYKWFILEHLRKTTTQVTHDEAVQVLTLLSQMKSESED